MWSFASGLTKHATCPRSLLELPLNNKSEKSCTLVLTRVDIQGATKACKLKDPTAPEPCRCPLFFCPYRVVVIPFHRFPCKRYMQCFYRQLRLCHRDNHGEFLWLSVWSLPCTTCQCVICPSGPPVNVTCNIFINSFGSIAETTMVSWALCLDLF